MKTIPLYKTNKVAVVDDEDYELVATHKWRLDRDGYAICTIRKGFRHATSMHRMVLGLKDRNVYTDHKDHNPLNNTRGNIRPCTNSQNQANRNVNRNGKPKSSKFKGVCWDSKLEKWRAQIGKNPRRHLGSFQEESDAALAYNAAAVSLYGEFACLNVVDTEMTPVL